MNKLTDSAIQALSADEINAHLVRLMAESGLTLLKRDEPLPYTFDLFHDIKEWHEVDSILKGEPHCSGLGSDELRRFAQTYGYVLDHPAACSFTSDWSAAGKLMAAMYKGHRFALTAEEGGARATGVDRLGYFHAFQDVEPLVAAMRCALAIQQVEMAHG